MGWKVGFESLEFWLEPCSLFSSDSLVLVLNNLLKPGVKMGFYCHLFSARFSLLNSMHLTETFTVARIYKWLELGPGWRIQIAT